MNALLSPELAKQVSERVEDRLDSLRYEIQSAYEKIRRTQEAMKEVEGRIVELFAVAERFRAAGFEYRFGSWTEAIFVTARETDLTTIYKLVGRLKLDSKSVANARKKLVSVTLSSVKYPFVFVEYEKKLSKGAKCKIERTKYKSYSSYSLVCER